MNIFLATITVAVFLGAAQAAWFSESDHQRVASLLKNVNDLQSAYYASIGLKALQQQVPSNVCSFAQKANDDDVNELYYAAAIVDASSDCKVQTPDAAKTISAILSSDKSEPSSIYRAVFAAKTFSVNVDADDVIATLKDVFEGQTAPSSAGYAFSTAALVTSDAKKLKAFVSEVEDIVAQLEESNGNYNFPGGLSSTVIALRGIFELAAAASEAPEFSAKQVSGIASFLLANKFVHAPAEAATLVIGLRILSSNSFQVPLIVSADQNRLSSSQKIITVFAGNAIGGQAALLTVEATLENLQGSKKTATVALNAGPKSAYTADLSSYSLKRGANRVKIVARPVAQDAKFIAANTFITVTVTTRVAVVDAELTRDGAFGKKSWTLTQPSSLTEKLDFDDQNHILLKFKTVEASSNADVTVHQAFLIFTSKQSGKQAVIVAEPSSTGYSIDVNLAKEVATFNYVSDDYEATLLIGDDALEQAIQWHLGTFNLRFKASAPATKNIDHFQPLPEIAHTFREPDKRAPFIVGLAFGLAALAPILVLIALWVKEGANIGDFSASPAALVFHASVAAILFLYVQFFLKLNMFQTLQWLLLLAPITIVSGKFTLSGIAAKRAKSA